MSNHEGLGSFRSLTVRLAASLTIALLPLGLIAVFQTKKVITDAENLSKREILTRTLDVARAHLEIITEAQGASTALSAAVAEIGPADALCSNVMKRLPTRTRSLRLRASLKPAA